ncbi:MAG: SGNH/GDSL hydrolase family protein [Bacteroidota bacterium]
MSGKITVVSALLILTFIAERPKVFVIGDSISIHYGPYLAQYLGADFQYARKGDNGEALQNLDVPVGANGGDSRMVLDYLKELLQNEQFTADYILLNCGLHDIKTKPETYEKQVEIKEFRSNLASIFRLINEADIKPIFITTTSVVDSIHNNKMPHFFRYQEDVAAYNQVAKDLCAKLQIPLIDLNTFTQNLGGPEIYSDHVHFKEEIRALQAAFITGRLRSYVQDH